MVTLIVTSMSEPVKRNYASTLRAEQARATRRAIVDAAAQLFVERGYGETTIDAIAQAAGVSRKTVFTSVGGKVEALKLARDWAIVGDDEPVPMLERPQVTRAKAEPDARVILRQYAAMLSASASRVGRLQVVIDEATGADPAVRELADEGRRQRLTGMRDMAREIARRGALRDGLTVERAADLLCLSNDGRAYVWLVQERGWTRARFEQWLGDTLIAQLIRPDYEG
jgi:AcrR family transcriptional regulator